MSTMNKPNTRRRKKMITRIKPGQRFLAMSKLIGLFIMLIIVAIAVYSMYEMHLQNDLSSLSQLIISVFGFGTIYIGFYLNMAKWEHVEAEKTAREKEVLRLKKQLKLYNENEQVEENIENLTEKINELNQKADDILAENNNYDCY